MDSDLAATVTDTNGSGSATASASVEVLTPCDLSVLPTPAHQYIHALEQRIIALEAEQKRFMNALQYAGKMLFDNSAMKMFSSAFPKEVKAKLQEFFNGNAVTGKT